MKLRATILMLAAFAIVSCASQKADRPSRSIIEAPSGDGDLMIGALAQSALPAGSCGMILWTLEADQPTPIYRQIQGKNGEIMLNGRSLSLSITDKSGASGFGVFEETTMAADKVTATVRVRFGLGFEGGVYLERGLLTVESETGWRSVVPAAGIAGCRAK
jgi:hypothetical protein